MAFFFSKNDITKLEKKNKERAHPEITIKKHTEIHHVEQLYGRSRSILEQSKNGKPCRTALSPLRILILSRLSSVIKFE